MAVVDTAAGGEMAAAMVVVAGVADDTNFFVETAILTLSEAKG